VEPKVCGGFACAVATVGMVNAATEVEATAASDEEGATMGVTGDSLSEYERARLKRMERNEAMLKELGLLSFKGCGVSRARARASAPSSSARRPTRPRGGSERRRRSRRLSSSSSSPDDFVMLGGSGGGDCYVEPQPVVLAGDDSAAQRGGRGHLSRRARPRSSSRRRSPSPPPPIPPRAKKRKVAAPAVGMADCSPLTAEQKKIVRSYLPRVNVKGGYLDELEDYLTPLISQDNCRNVLRQISKLAHGEGIRYESARYGWPEGCYFKKDVIVTPLDDIVHLLREAKDCEDRWGRDHGNGTYEKKC